MSGYVVPKDPPANFKLTDVTIDAARLLKRLLEKDGDEIPQWVRDAADGKDPRASVPSRGPADTREPPGDAGDATEVRTSFDEQQGWQVNVVRSGHPNPAGLRTDVFQQLRRVQEVDLPGQRDLCDRLLHDLQSHFVAWNHLEWLWADLGRVNGQQLAEIVDEAKLDQHEAGMLGTLLGRLARHGNLDSDLDSDLVDVRVAEARSHERRSSA